MAPEPVSQDQIIQHVSGNVLSYEGDSVWDNIFDMILYAATIGGGVPATLLPLIFTPVKYAIELSLQQQNTQIYSALELMTRRLESSIAAAYDVKQSIKGLEEHIEISEDTIATRTAAYIMNQFIPVTESLHDKDRAYFDDTRNFIISTVVDESRGIYVGINALDVRQQDVAHFLNGTLLGLSSDMYEQTGNVIEFVDYRMGAAQDGIIDWIKDHVVDPVVGWFTSFLDRLFDFGAWVGEFIQALWNWVSRDVPGHSPWYEEILGNIISFVITWFTWLPSKIAPSMIEAIAPPVINALRPIGDLFNTVAELFDDAIHDFVHSLGPTNPDIAGSNAKSLGAVGMTAVAGLAGMTLASSWMKPLGGAGMGQIAAMIYDMTNFKVITGASITALSIAAIRTPMTYHFNELFRPNILPERDFMQLMSRKAFVDPEPLRNPELTKSIKSLRRGGAGDYEGSYLAYRGYPSNYIGLYKELANTPLRYFPLAGIARTGFYDFEWFDEALHRSGYSKTAIEALHVMYKKMVDETLQGTMSGAAVTRFKEGFTTEDQFRSEMMLLGYSDEQFAKYLIAAELDYATDYLRDLLAAYKDAVRKGNISIADYRDRLLGLGLVPERVEAYVLREQARLKPGDELTPIGGPAAVYESDAGKIQVDTIRRERRKLLISADAELTALTTLGMPENLAGAMVANDDVRLAEKAEEG